MVSIHPDFGQRFNVHETSSGGAKPGSGPHIVDIPLNAEPRDQRFSEPNEAGGQIFVDREPLVCGFEEEFDNGVKRVQRTASFALFKQVVCEIELVGCLTWM